MHPFPSLLNALATAAISTLAGAPPLTAARLGLAMLAIQCSIGALNDLVDAPLDARQKPRKPIPSGLTGRRAAIAVAVLGAALGIVLSLGSGGATGLAAVGCLALGYAYDLRLSRTALSWLPLALALPLLPIHAWLGATNDVPPGLVTLVPVAVLGGAGLALANALVDIERDRTVGRRGIVVTLGRWPAWLVQTAVVGVAATLVLVLAPTIPSDAARPGVEILRLVRIGGVAIGIALLGVGAAALASDRPGMRERGWELEAIGVAGLGLGWLAGTAGSVGGAVAAAGMRALSDAGAAL